MDYKRLWTGISRIAGVKIWIASLVPMMVATVMAYIEIGRIEFKWWTLSIVGILLIETLKHCMNDIVDYKSGVDLSIMPEQFTEFSGGKKVLTENILTIKEVKNIGILIFLIVVAIGTYISVAWEPKAFYIGIIGVFLACAYSLPPFSFCYRGLGEITVGITYGPLLMLGMYVVLTRHVSAFPLLVSIPLGIIITNVLWINQYPDYEADKKNNKRNWVVRLGKKKSLVVYAINYFLAYLFFVGMGVHTNNYLWLLGLASIPMAWKSYLIAAKYYDYIPKMVRANQLTVNVYIITGLCIIATLILTKLII